MDKARIEAFSDGVFAVAITLLALNLTVDGPGHGTLAHQLADRWPSFAAYAVSFLTIGIIAVNHHALFKTFARTDRTLAFLNLVLLLFVALIPFATATTATYMRGGGTDAHLAAALYEAVFEGMSIGFFLSFVWALRRNLLVAPLTPRESRAAVFRFGVIGNATYVVAIAVAFVNAVAALVITALIAIYYVFEQTPAASASKEPG